MPSRAQDLLREALALPLDERADVAAELLASLDGAAAEHPADVQAAWAAEIERRARRALADESAGVRFDDEADAEYRFAGRWYEARREHVGVEFLDAVDATIDQIVACRALALRFDDCPPTCQFDAVR